MVREEGRAEGRGRRGEGPGRREGCLVIVTRTDTAKFGEQSGLWTRLAPSHVLRVIAMSREPSGRPHWVQMPWTLEG
jgi:hypothetical protein